MPRIPGSDGIVQGISENVQVANINPGAFRRTGDALANLGGQALDISTQLMEQRERSASISRFTKNTDSIRQKNEILKTTVKNNTDENGFLNPYTTSKDEMGNDILVRNSLPPELGGGLVPASEVKDPISGKVELQASVKANDFYREKMRASYQQTYERAGSDYEANLYAQSFEPELMRDQLDMDNYVNMHVAQQAIIKISNRNEKLVSNLANVTNPTRTNLIFSTEEMVKNNLSGVGSLYSEAAMNEANKKEASRLAATYLENSFELRTPESVAEAEAYLLADMNLDGDQKDFYKAKNVETISKEEFFMLPIEAQRDYAFNDEDQNYSKALESEVTMAGLAIKDFPPILKDALTTEQRKLYLGKLADAKASIRGEKLYMLNDQINGAIARAQSGDLSPTFASSEEFNLMGETLMGTPNSDFKGGFAEKIRLVQKMSIIATTVQDTRNFAGQSPEQREASLEDSQKRFQEFASNLIDKEKDPDLWTYVNSKNFNAEFASEFKKIATERNKELVKQFKKSNAVYAIKHDDKTRGSYNNFNKAVAEGNPAKIAAARAQYKQDVKNFTNRVGVFDPVVSKVYPEEIVKREALAMQQLMLAGETEKLADHVGMMSVKYGEDYRKIGQQILKDNKKFPEDLFSVVYAADPEARVTMAKNITVKEDLLEFRKNLSKEENNKVAMKDFDAITRRETDLLLNSLGKSQVGTERASAIRSFSEAIKLETLRLMGGAESSSGWFTKTRKAKDSFTTGDIEDYAKQATQTILKSSFQFPENTSIHIPMEEVQKTGRVDLGNDVSRFNTFIKENPDKIIDYTKMDILMPSMDRVNQERKDAGAEPISKKEMQKRFLEESFSNKNAEFITSPDGTGVMIKYKNNSGQDAYLRRGKGDNIVIPWNDIINNPAFSGWKE